MKYIGREIIEWRYDLIGSSQSRIWKLICYLLEFIDTKLVMDSATAENS